MRNWVCNWFIALGEGNFKAKIKGVLPPIP